VSELLSLSTDATVLHKFGTGFSLGGGCYFVHVIQGDRVLIMFSLNLADIPWQSCPEELHLEELHPIVDKIVLPFCGSGIQIAPVSVVLGGLDLVLISSVALLDDHHGVVILASNSPVNSICFIARLESPSMINLLSD